MDNARPRFTRAVIPTNSLFLLSDIVSKEFFNKISFIRATSQQGQKDETFNPHKFVQYHRKIQQQCFFRFNQRTAKEPFDILEILEAVRSVGLADLWIHELRLRLEYDLGFFDFIFKNRPFTPGSEAEKWAANYINRLKAEGMIYKAQYRHLPLINTKSIPEGNNLDIYEIANPAFIRWLHSETDGLVKMKIVEQIDETSFRDLSIKDF